jgi:hypothetical protein
MKKIYFTLIVLISATVAFAQDMNQLKFSRVLLVNQTTNQTVPSGKVWKVESVLHKIDPNRSGMINEYQSGATACNDWDVSRVSGSYAIYVNNIPTRVGGTSAWESGGTGRSTILSSLPIWLPQGTTLRVECNFTQISIIEFTVVAE